MGFRFRASRTTGNTRGVDIGGASAIGARAELQDRYEFSTRWAILSDGIGGYAGGARAAELTVEAVAEVLEGGSADELATLAQIAASAIGRANEAVVRARRADPERSRMGATVTLAAAASPGTWVVANLGDSPAWLVRSDETLPLIEEHNLAAQLLREGVLTSESAHAHPGRHVLVRAVGLAETAEPFVQLVDVQPGERIVLASDGLAGGVDTAALHRAWRRRGRGSAAFDARTLVEAAISGGATDNVTVVVVRRVAGSDGAQQL